MLLFLEILVFKMHFIFILLLLWPSAIYAGVSQQPTDISGSTAYIYKRTEQAELRIHHFRAKKVQGGGELPAIIFFFGGGWQAGSVTQFVPQAKYLAGRGMEAFIADYRVLNRHGTMPFAALADAKSAIRWLRAHADLLNIDPDRIAASGGSAGGHLALASAMFVGFDEAEEIRIFSSKPDALVLFNPALDTTKPRHFEMFGERMKEISPMHNLQGALPPTVIMHGREDAAVPYEMAEKFCGDANALGGRCTFHGYAGARHGFFNGRFWREKTMNKMDKFLTDIGYLRAKK